MMSMRRFGILAVLAAALCANGASGQTANQAPNQTPKPARGPLEFKPPAPGQPPDIAFYGTWTIDMPKTVAARGGKPLVLQTMTPSDSFTWTFVPEKDGMRVAVYRSCPAPAPDRSYFARLDGKAYPDPHGPGRGLGVTGVQCLGDCQEFIRLVVLDRYTLAREVVTKGAWTERVLYSVSEDGNTLVIITSPPRDPANVNRMIFTRRPEPGRPAR